MDISKIEEGTIILEKPTDIYFGRIVLKIYRNSNDKLVRDILYPKDGYAINKGIGLNLYNSNKFYSIEKHKNPKMLRLLYG